MVAGLAGVAAAEETVVLAETGTVRCVVVASRRVVEAPTVKKSAAIWIDDRPAVHLERLRDSVTDLARTLGKIARVEIEVTTNAAPPGDGRIPILVGEPATERFGPAARHTKYKQGLRVVVTPEAVGLIGESDLAASYAIYELLDRLGCRWYMPSEMGEVLPDLPVLRVPVMDVSSAPYTIYRGIWFADNDYGRRNRLGGLYLRAGHALEGYVSDEQRKAHPEWQGYYEGKPYGRRLRWSQPGVAEAIADGVLDYLAKSPHVRSVSLSPNDGLGYDDTEDTKLDAGDFDPTLQQVSITDRQVWLCNRVIERVVRKYPDVLFGMLAYAQSTRPPVREVPHPNLVPVIAPITYRRAHPMTWEGIPGNEALRAAVTGWADKADKVAYYFYGWFLAEPSAPSPFICKWGEDLKFIYAKGGCRFWQPETLATFDSNFLGLYMSLRMAWDPNQDPDDIIAELHKKFYGQAAKPMLDYWYLVDQVWTTSEECSGCGFGHLRRWSPAHLGLARQLLEVARKNVRSRTVMQRVEMVNENLHLFELFMQMRAELAEGRFASLSTHADQYTKQAQSLAERYKDQYAFGGAWYLAGGDKTWYVKYFNDFYRRTYDDATRIARNFAMVTEHPLRQWHYRIDPDKKGEARKWHTSGYDASAWDVTDTCLDTWSTLGHHNYMGVMWYRDEVGVPDIPEGKKVYLWIGATDGSAKLFVNGQHVPYVDSSGETKDAFSGYCTPVSFDVTDTLVSGQKNLLVVKCERTNLNELGTGGILGSPVVIYREKSDANGGEE